MSRDADLVPHGHLRQRVPRRHDVDLELQEGDVRRLERRLHRVAEILGDFQLVPVRRRRRDEEVQLGVARQQGVQRELPRRGTGSAGPRSDPGRSRSTRGRVPPDVEAVAPGVTQDPARGRGTGARKPPSPGEGPPSSSAPSSRSRGCAAGSPRAFPRRSCTPPGQGTSPRKWRSSPPASRAMPPWPFARRASRPPTGPCAGRRGRPCCA